MTTRHKSSDHRSMKREPTSPSPTLEQLRRGTPWCWVVCEKCLHRTPVAFVPFIIRWGPDASSDMLRRSARCTKCGRRERFYSIRAGREFRSGSNPFRSLLNCPKYSTVSSAGIRGTTP
jgi:hypothetical protein